MSEKEPMRAEQKSNVKNSIGRLGVTGISIIIQVLWIIFLFIRLNRYSTVISLFSSILALIVVLHIYGKRSNAAFKMPWIILILAFPVAGLCIYGIFGNANSTRKMRDKFAELDRELEPLNPQDPGVMMSLEKENYAIANEFRYVRDYGKYPVYRNTDIQFYDDAAKGLEAQLAELKKAEKFIFMEYHAIEEAEAFERIKTVLAERAAAGVDVRLFYDDVGSIGFINTDFIRRMEAVGVKCRVFNPVIPILNVFMNNRDHRKITVIDGKVGFTGGYNLANEYFNLTHPYGHWKDTGIRLEGDAVRSLTVMFLEMWKAMERRGKQVQLIPDDYRQFLEIPEYHSKENGYVQPYADSPLDDEYLGESVYLNLIKGAAHSFYAATPYLIISDEMTRELGLAAKRGVDVRIITPGIPDKKIIYKVTRSYYAGLVRQGVRIYEYTPGFIHAKQTVADDRIATIGTINFDYRSLYHHFENGVLMYDVEAVHGIHKDFEALFDVCEEVTEKYRTGRSVALRIGQCILRLFAPLL